MRRTIVAVETDTHGGSTFGLLNPETILYTEGRNGDPRPFTPALTWLQEYFWQLRTKNMERIAEIADGDEIIYFHLGDPTNGNKHNDYSVSARIADQFTIAEQNLAPIYQLPNLIAVCMFVGTDAHNFGLGSADVAISRYLQEKYQNIKTDLYYHGKITILGGDGYVCDCAHHGPGPGIRDWLRGNVARFYLRDLMYREMKRHNKPPNAVLRGHYHTPVHETLEDGDDKSELWIVPSFCGMNDYGEQVTQSNDQMTFGNLVLEIEDGVKIGEYRLYDGMDLRTEVTL